MTTHDHNNRASDRVVAYFHNGDAAREAALGIEQLGIDSGLVHIESDSHLRPEAAESKMDAAAIERPRRKASQGMVVGGIIGLVVGIGVGLAFDVLPLVVAAGLFVIPGVALGGLFGVYSRLSTNPSTNEADAGGEVTVTLDLTTLDDEEREAAVAKLRAAQPLRLVEA
jgi:hypothetical protein